MNIESYQRQGMYDPSNEHDACGVGLLVNIHGAKSHDIVDKGLKVLENMVHRGAESADNKTGDGAGILVQIPHEFILLQGIALPEKGTYGTGLIFLPKDAEKAEIALKVISDLVSEESFKLLTLRDVPVNSDILGSISRSNEPTIKQLFLSDGSRNDELERHLYILRKKIEQAFINIKQDTTHPLASERNLYVVSLSCRQMIYKGMLTSEQLRDYYPDLSSPYFTSGIALVHSRFSTNTFPTWDLAQPFRFLGHNGEINTIKGNRFWTEAKEGPLVSKTLGDLEKLYPIIQPGMSDSASLDNVLEFLVMTGRSLPHAMSMLVPESWNSKNPISNELKAFYEYNSIFMEPWDGPATLLFSDGRYAGGMLDRNGLRPARYVITTNDTVIVASEVGTLDFDPTEIKEKGRLKPGKILMIDTQEGTIQYDPELKDTLAKAYPYKEWLEKNRIRLYDLSSGRSVKNTVDNFPKLLRAFGYTKEDLQLLIGPMAQEGKEPISSMGNDVPFAAISEKPQRLFNYFRQQFAQVTNPPIDPIREELVMSLTGYVGAVDSTLLDIEPGTSKMLKLNSPILTNTEFDILLNLKYKGFVSETLDMTYPVEEGAKGMEASLDRLCKQAEAAADKGVNYIVLSDRKINEKNAALPSLMTVSAVHHYLIRQHKRLQTAVIVETGEAREINDFALLIGFGASAINPYMAFACLDKMIKDGEIQLDYETAQKHYIKAIDKGILKTMSKMGISTIRSYRGAQIFEAIGISNQVLQKYFRGTISKIEGVGMNEIANEIAIQHNDGFFSEHHAEELENTGQYAYRKAGETHAWNPQTIANLQLSTRLNSYEKFKQYTRLVDEKEKPIFLRDFMEFKKENAIPLEQVEPVSSITKRFVTGAMSYGSISAEAHEAMAIAMNALGGKSNTGEGGEDPVRYLPRPDGTSTRSAIKQIASGRFGVTAEYLVNADELQIKVAQGAKPGEGGQLPGFKVDEIIAKTRHSIPGISLISPPPHHDIYSIEDLAQLIFDLKNINPKARVSVKLVSESGVGTIAAGVAKAKADMILISGCEGGTGASPSSSIKHAGLPVELGLAETQQTLVLNNLRGQIRLQTDGQLKTGRDIIIAALLGAEEYGFATSALIVLGCVMMRKCHLNTCPMGVATQDTELRKRFKGKSEYLINFFTFLAQDVREHLAEMGYKSLDEIIGRTDLLSYNSQNSNEKAKTIRLDALLATPAGAQNNARKNIKSQEHKLDVLDKKLIEIAKKSIEDQTPISADLPICNTNRSVGAMLSGEVAKRYGNQGLPADTIRFNFKGSAGQSFGAFLSAGLSFRIEGDANDYLGKGLSGGKITVVPPVGSHFEPENNIIAGNTLLYGATKGEVYINGVVGERFCVRNSGAIAVVEGAGDHCCEYMTGGRTVVLGKVGRNFAAGMSGGLAYVLDLEGNFDYFCNMEMVELSLIEDSYDSRELKSLINTHYEQTQSPLAKRILDNWAEYVDKFIKVMPIEYKRVIQEEKLAAIRQKIDKVERDY